jgi:hypothetical protein
MVQTLTADDGSGKKLIGGAAAVDVPTESSVTTAAKTADLVKDESNILGYRIAI